MKKKFAIFFSFFFLLFTCGETLAQAASVEAAVNDGIALTALGDYGKVSLAFIDTSTSTTVATLSFDSAYVNNSSSLSSYLNYGFDRIRIYVYLDQPLDIADYNINFAIVWNDITQFDLNSCKFSVYTIIQGTSSYFMSNDVNSYSFRYYSNRFTLDCNFSNQNAGQVICFQIDSPDTIEISSSSFSLSAISISTSSDLDLTETNNLINNTNNWLSNILDTITSLPSTIINLLIDALKSLFIPSDGYFEDKFNTLYSSAEDTFGILLLPFEVLSDLVNVLVSSNSEFMLYFPSFQLTIAGSTYTLWQGQYIYVQEDLESNFSELITALHTITNVMLIGWVLRLLQRTYEQAVEGGESG